MALQVPELSQRRSMPAALQAPKTPPVYVCSRPSVVAGLPPARALAAGEGHSCAIARDEAVYCWGGTGERLGEPWTRPARRYQSAAVTKLVW